MNNDGTQRGFTLIELIVSIGLFSVVMMISVGALLSLVEANRKARALQSVMNNLNVTLDGMVRAIRMGAAYNCGTEGVPGSGGEDCPTGGTTFSFAPFGSSASAANERWVYTFSDGRIYRSEEGGANSIEVTAPEVVIEEMNFYLTGSERRDGNQPKVVFVIKGIAGGDRLKTSATFYIQATAVQRSLDL
jgi:prepilin-type N-terminal cleavage/methylation domain-containing protein